MILQYLFLGPAQRRTNRGDLGDDVDAVTILLNHLGQAADLTFDPAQAFLAG